ncbi:MAG: hypothetical protein ACKV22_20535 [Bryobacteraceae bacterium]
MKRVLFLSLHSCLLLTVCLDLSAQALRRKPIFTLGTSRRLEVAAEDTAQLSVDSVSPNRVDAADLYSPLGLALDTSVTPPILYVSDTLNHRILAWRNAGSFANGAPADLILGQRDRYSALPQGPATGISTGFTLPLGLAVDRQGSLYVADAGNNRILRFPKPFSQPADSIFPDIVIGQTSFSANGANQGGLSDRSLFLGVQAARVGLTFDAQGNLFVTDVGNNRLLRYSANDLAEGRNGPRASLVLGQPDFTTNSAPANRDDKAKLVRPLSVALDSTGRIYVTDVGLRVLYYPASAANINGAPADRILGTRPRTVTGQPVLPPVNEFTIGAPANQPAEGIVVVDNRLLVLDSAANRALLYDPPEQWPAETQNQPSPPARFVFGQTNFNASNKDGGPGATNASGFSSPGAAIFSNGELFVADTGNNRILVFRQAAGTFSSASRVLGQLGFDLGAPNLLEGREFDNESGLALDASVSPPRVYVADTNNNRILGFRSLQAIRTGATADLVIGQVDLARALINSPGNDVERPNQTGLYLPTGLAVDLAGNLWVADTGNGRVLRFPKPFDRGGQTQQADLVIGQQSFTSKITDATSRTMRAPWGLALTLDGVDPARPGGGLTVADQAHHRVLYFAKPFATGMAATSVLGQPDFFTTLASSATNRFSQPRGIALDSEDRLYVADSANNRVQIYDRIHGVQGLAAPLATVPGINFPVSISISRNNGTFWVAEGSANRVLRFPRFDDLARVNFSSDSSLTWCTGGGLSCRASAVALDAFDNLLVADLAHRVSYYAPGLRVFNGANFAEGSLSPGTISSIFPVANTCGTIPCVIVNFGSETKAFDELPNPVPMPRELANLQVTVDDQAVPLYFVSPTQINFQLPMGLASSGSALVTVRNASTGQLYGTLDLGLKVASPAFFTRGASGSGPIAAVNQDNTIHAPTNAIRVGDVIALYGTGQGYVPGAPPDGSPAQGLTPTPNRPRVTLDGRAVPDENITYSGLAPELLGVWQLNLKIPDNAPIGNAVRLVAFMNDISSLDPANAARVQTTIAIRTR